jgi:hypothetical protein
MNFERLESAAGYMCHLSMTHEVFRPFLKEIYLMLNSWRVQRDKDGWKVPDNRWMAFLAGCEDNGEPVMSHDADAPATVKATPSLKDGVEALRELLAPELPPRLMVRSVRTLFVVYGFGDASGK